MTNSSAPLSLRVTIGDTWLPRPLTAAPSDTVASVKSRALLAQQIDARRHGWYEVKYGGAPLRDESRTLAACGVTNGAALVVLARHRRPVR